MLARGDGRAAAGRLPLLRRERRAAGAALRHDGADRPPGRQPLRRRRAAAAPLLPGQRLPRGAPAARPDARVRPGRGRADRRPGAGGHGRGDRGAGGGARRGRPRPRRDRARRRRPLPPAARPSSGSRARRATRSSRGLATHDLVGLEAELAELEGIGDERARDLRRALAAARRPRGARARRAALGGAAVERATARLRRDLRGAGARAASPTGSRSTSACCATSATTAARSSRSTTRRSATCSAAAAATTS